MQMESPLTSGFGIPMGGDMSSPDDEYYRLIYTGHGRSVTVEGYATTATQVAGLFAGLMLAVGFHPDTIKAIVIGEEE
jgi:hypothetical protein